MTPTPRAAACPETPRLVAWGTSVLGSGARAAARRAPLGAPLDAHWEAHARTCGPCGDAWASLNAVASTLAEHEARQASTLMGSSARLPWRTWWVVGSIAAALLAAALLIATRSGGTGDAPPSREARILEARRLHLEGRFEEGLRVADALVAQGPDRTALFERGINLLRLGRRDAAIDALRAARQAADEAGADGLRIERWYVESHLAQALLHPLATPAQEQGFLTLVRQGLAGPGSARSQHRGQLWSDLALLRALARGDVAGGEEALRWAEAENADHRRLTAQESGTAEDIHYVLQARFGFAQAVRADSEAGRAVARDLFAAKSRTADRLGEASAATMRGDALEVLARAELLAARRGDPADLGAAEVRLTQALALRERGGNRQGLAWCRTSLGMVHLLRGDGPAALHWADLGVAAALESGEPRTVLSARLVRIQALLALGRRADARAALDEAQAASNPAPDATRDVTLAALAVALDAEAASARARLEQARSSPLRDVRLLAARALEALAAGRGLAPGTDDLMIAP